METMLTPETVRGIIITALNTLNLELPDDRKIEPSGDTVLFGVNAQIDSLSLVSLIVDVETALNGDFGLDVSLTDDRAMSRAISPYTDVGALETYILELAGEK